MGGSNTRPRIARPDSRPDSRLDRVGVIEVSKRSERRQRRGQSLVFFAFMIFVFAGIMALTFDFGFVLLARRQMQTAVDAAALEGMRDTSDRRENARGLLRLNFDDDLDLDSNATTLGAGIANSLTQGDGYQVTTLGNGTFGTSGMLSNRSDYVYRPDGFELNDANQIHGDMVVGHFDTASTDHSESSSYTRSDFTSDQNGSAFLVRMRRTHDSDGLDAVPDVSSTGGGVPLLIGRLAWLPATSPGDAFSFRRDGTTIRATAIANDRPVVAVFVTTDTRFYPVLPYTLRFDGSTEEWRDSVVADMYVEDPESPGQPLLPLRIAVGTTVSGTATSEPASPEGYVPIVDAGDRIIGFRLFESDPSMIRNDSPRLQDAWAVLGELGQSDRDAVMNANRTEADDLGLVRAPALERSIR